MIYQYSMSQEAKPTARLIYIVLDVLLVMETAVLHLIWWIMRSMCPVFLLDRYRGLQVIKTFEETFNPHKDKGPLIREVREENIPELEELLSRII